MKHLQINISYLIYTTGQIQIKIDIIHRKKIQSPSEVRQYYSICSLKTEKRKKKQIIQKIAQRNSKYQDNFGHSF